MMVLLLITEGLIAAYLHDALIRPYGGDFLVVILIYCFVKSFLSTPVTITAIGVLLFAYAVEFSQYVHIINRLGWEKSKMARVLMGTFFSWTDMLAYTLGTLLILVAEAIRRKYNSVQMAGSEQH